jgi:glucose-6-phosphate isomerase
MINLNSKNSTITDLSSHASLIPEYLEKIHARKKMFYRVVDDEEVLKPIEDFAETIKGKYDHIVVLGIGGSALGMICLQQSLKHLFENELIENEHPKLHVLDNIDPALITQIEDVIDYNRTLFIVISKSGRTPETISQYFYYRKQCDDRDLNPKKHFVFITDAEKGILRLKSQKEGIQTFTIPSAVGGRFSVLTPVGLLPAALIGINIRELLKGAREMRDKFLSENFDDNLSFQIAAMQYLLDKEGKSMTVIMPYSHRLIRFADWYRQLLAESIGKEVNEKGEKVNVGLTPINALGVTDQHSQSQLYNEGPNNKFLILIKVRNLGPEVEIPHLCPEECDVEFLKNVSFNDLMHTEQEAATQSLTHNNRPNVTLTVDEINEYTLGGLFMLFEGATAFLGEFYGINAFNQPGVELSKKFTKDLLTKS